MNEKFIVKQYRAICTEPSEEKINSRIQGIQKILMSCDEVKEIQILLAIYFNIPHEQEKENSFVTVFCETDKMFDGDNKEEMRILAGCALAELLRENEDVFTAYSIKFLEAYYEHAIDELSELADEAIASGTLEKKEQMDEMDDFHLKNNWEKEIASEGDWTDTAADTVVGILKKYQQYMKKLAALSNSLLKENMKCKEKTEILSWIMGEWSDLLKKPLSEISDKEGALVLGIELANLSGFPGSYAAKELLHKMLGKCKQTNKEIALTELIDCQEENTRKKIAALYEGTYEELYLPIISAINYSLEVDGAGEWVPMYKKKFHIKPDEVKYAIVEWSYYVYMEVMAINDLS